MKSYKLSLIHLFLILLGSLILGLLFTFKETLKNRSLKDCKALQRNCNCEAEKRNDFKQRIPVYRNCMKDRGCGYCIKSNKKGESACNPNPGTC